MKTISEIRSISGNEHKIRSYIVKEIKKNIKDVKVDKYGNIVAHKKGSGAKVMLLAHMDEIGLMVKSIGENGNIYVSEIGTIEATAIIGETVKIQTKKGTITGIITFPEIHDDEELEEVGGIESVIVVTGLTKNELDKKGVEVGSFVEFEKETITLGKKDIICGKALDDRIGCFILLELAKKLKQSKANVYFVFTVQEEIGLYGSKTSVHSIDPDWALAIDVTNADDSKEHTHEITKSVGDGPCVTVKDADMISNVCIDNWIKKIAKKKKIPIQLEVSDAGTTDALSISVAKGGIPTAVLGVAVKNLHTCMGIASMSDIKNAIKILTELLKNPPKVCLD
tara:strand:+ start:374 stop:1390 length:1017 start_codon:yes stop_codon:yes gene_type:complete